MTTNSYAYPETLDEPLSGAPKSFIVRCGNAIATLALDRALVILLPVAVVLLAPGISSKRLLAIAVVAAVWFAALQSWQARPRLSVALGTGVVTGVGTISGLAAVSLLGFWLPTLELQTRQLLLIAPAIFLTTATLDAQMERRRSRRRVLFVGEDDGIRDSVERLSRHPQLPFDSLGVVVDVDDGWAGLAPRVGATADLGEILRVYQPDLVVLGSEVPRADALSQVLDASPLKIRVTDLHQFSEHAFGMVPVHRISPDWFMSVLDLYQRPYSRFAKRTFDLALASVALIVLAPVLLVVGLIVYMSSPGPTLFRQVRLGEGGRLFEMLKFRTMVDGAEEPGVAVWAQLDDARVTPVGELLRRMRIDELPQLWNVIRGDMSIVGPRPERPEFLELLRETVPFWTRRHLVKPGITGWAQVRRGYTSDTSGTAEKLSYDLYYLKYRSLLLDLAIVAQTARVVLLGSGAR
jgi:exopolysaccharide biosynthesis polyprenyl glycosylphosphotransferase